MQKLVKMKPVYKIALAVVFFVLSCFGFHSEIKNLGYLCLFAGLFVIFEGFGFSLFVKILSALALSFVIALSGLISNVDLLVINPVGSKIFMNALTMALVPLVFASILTGVTNLGDIKKLNRIGTRTIAYYILTTVVAITIGLGFANIMQPGQELDEAIKQNLVMTYNAEAQTTLTSAKENQKTLFETMQDIVPRNILESVSLQKPDMLSLIFFAVICGVALLHIAPDKAKPVIDFFTGITDMTVMIVSMVMRLAPYGVFALITSTLAGTEGLDLIWSLVPFSACVLLGLLVHFLFINGISVKVLSKKNPFEFFKKSREVVLTAFSTSSSGATMPLTLQVVQTEMNVSKEVAGFVIPLGATINMDGTALFQGVSALFLANIYGIELGFTGQLTVIAMAVMASIGTAAVPGVGIVVLTMILVSVGIPAEGILFILPVNNLLDMFRTAVNVIGDMACAVYIDSVEAVSDVSASISGSTNTVRLPGKMANPSVTS